MKINYSGKSYEVTVPDTLDLAERAELAINGIGGTIDPKLHYTMFFFVNYACKTPYMQHLGCSDTSCDPKFAESFPMMRIICGSEQYIDIETAQRAELVARIKDGLYWNFHDPERPWYNTIYNRIVGDTKNEDLANVGATGRMFRILGIWKELDNNQVLDKLMREMVDGMTKIAIRREDYSYYPDGGFGESFSYPRSGWLKTDEPKTETEGTEGAVVCYHGNQIYGSAKWYAISGDTKALDLAARLTRFCMLPKFWGGIPDPERHTEGLPTIAAPLPDPACVAGKEMGHWYSHFHARALALRGMLEYGRIVGDWRVLEFVKRSYEYTLTLGIPRIGWIVTHPAAAMVHNMCEGCALGDLVALGIRLTDTGIGDYWDDIDAVVRNHLVEQQLVRADFLEKISSISPVCDNSKLYPNQEVTDNVIQRSLGNFAGLSTPTSIPKPWVMQCCTGNGTQGLYYAWEGIVRENGDSAQVNLLLNRATKCLDVDSYLPYEGRVIINNKILRRISVRIPSWVMRKEIRCDVSGKPRPCIWIGNYLMFDELKPNDKINIEFPVKETTAKYTACSRTPEEQTYTCTFRGSTLVDISPRDTSPNSYPLYLRDHMRQDKAPMKKVTRFVSDKIIHNW